MNTALATGLPSWEDVLAEVEADVARSEHLLSSVHDAAGGLAFGQLSPAELMLPTQSPALPDVAVMPKVPAELADRISSLRDRIAELSKEMSTALNEVGALLVSVQAQDRTVRPIAAAPRPRFVDRSM